MSHLLAPLRPVPSCFGPLNPKLKFDAMGPVINFPFLSVSLQLFSIMKAIKIVYLMTTYQ